MSLKIRLTLLCAAMAVASTSLAFSRDAGLPGAVPYAVTFDNATAPQTEAAPVSKEPPSDASSGILVLIGFLGLIAGNLLRWSGDTSGKSNPSVFS